MCCTILPHFATRLLKRVVKCDCATQLQIEKRRGRVKIPMLTTKKKATVMKSTARHDTDTGSPDVQVALLSKQIDELAKHLKKNPKDFHSRRGLLQMVADRRSHLRYLETSNKRRYNALIKKLGLKK